jgi:hypothetical protein
MDKKVGLLAIWTHEIILSWLVFERIGGMLTILLGDEPGFRSGLST